MSAAENGGPCGILGCGILRDYHDDEGHEWSASFVPGDTGEPDDDEGAD